VEARVGTQHAFRKRPAPNLVRLLNITNTIVIVVLVFVVPIAVSIFFILGQRTNVKD
jgi:hypothetical protein